MKNEKATAVGAVDYIFESTEISLPFSVEKSNINNRMEYVHVGYIPAIVQ